MLDGDTPGNVWPGSIHTRIMRLRYSGVDSFWNGDQDPP
jgi:hypothetical protein